MLQCDALCICKKGLIEHLLTHIWHLSANLAEKVTETHVPTHMHES